MVSGSARAILMVAAVAVALFSEAVASPAHSPRHGSRSNRGNLTHHRNMARGPHAIATAHPAPLHHIPNAAGVHHEIRMHSRESRQFDRPLPPTPHVPLSSAREMPPLPPTPRSLPPTPRGSGHPVVREHPALPPTPGTRHSRSSVNEGPLPTPPQ